MQNGHRDTKDEEPSLSINRWPSQTVPKYQHAKWHVPVIGKA